MQIIRRAIRPAVVVVAIVSVTTAACWWLIPAERRTTAEIRVSAADTSALDLPPFDVGVATGPAVVGQATTVADQAGGALVSGPRLGQAGDANQLVVVTSDPASAQAVVSLIDAVLEASAPEARVTTSAEYSSATRWGPTIAVWGVTVVFALVVAYAAAGALRSRRDALDRARRRGAVVMRAPLPPRPTVVVEPSPIKPMRRSAVPRFRAVPARDRTTPRDHASG